MSVAISGISVMRPLLQEHQPAPTKSEPKAAPVAGIQNNAEKRWHESIASLLRYRAFEDDWDGEGARAPDPEIVDSVVALLKLPEFRNNFPPPDRMIPRHAGGLLLEWMLPTLYLTAWIDAPGRAQCVYIAPDQGEQCYQWNWLSEDQGIVWSK